MVKALAIAVGVVVALGVALKLADLYVIDVRTEENYGDLIEP